MPYYCDGSTYKNGQEGQDSSFLVVCSDGTVIRKHIGDVSINYAELAAIKKACELCDIGETIFSDSMIAVNWAVNPKLTKNNIYLWDEITETNKLVHTKGLDIRQVPRDYNLAGIKIEEDPFYETVYDKGKSRRIINI
jgi:ribonuclease HI